MARRLFCNPIIKEGICRYLDFDSALSFRDALDLPSLKCSVRVINPWSNTRCSDLPEIILPGVNETTVAVNGMIQQYGISQAFMKAIEYGDDLVVTTLLNTGLDINTSIDTLVHREWTGLMAAASNGREEIVQQLLERGAKVDLELLSEGSALICAAEIGSIPIVKMLLEHGADVNRFDAYFNTALILAAENNHQEIARILCEAGADRTVTNIYGRSALDSAQYYEHQDMVDLLSSFN